MCVNLIGLVILSGEYFAMTLHKKFHGFLILASTVAFFVTLGMVFPNFANAQVGVVSSGHTKYTTKADAYNALKANCYTLTNVASECDGCFYTCTCSIAPNEVVEITTQDLGGGTIKNPKEAKKVSTEWSIHVTSNSKSRQNGACCTKTVDCPTVNGEQTKTKDGKSTTEESACKPVIDPVTGKQISDKKTGKKCATCEAAQAPKCKAECEKEVANLNKAGTGYKSGSACETLKPTSVKKKSPEECGCLPCLVSVSPDKAVNVVTPSNISGSGNCVTSGPLTAGSKCCGLPIRKSDGTIFCGIGSGSFDNGHGGAPGD